MVVGDHQMLGRVFPNVPNLPQADLGVLRQVFSRRLSGEDSSDDQLHLFKQLFTEGQELIHDQAVKAIFPLKIESLVKSGLLEEVQGKICACMHIQYYRGLIFLSDFFHWEKRPDFVLPIGPAGRYLADLTIRLLVKSTLDLGCGCGIQSLLASRHSAKVTATDINPRALALTRLNAALNGITNIDILEGSYFEPVNENKFDLIVANLPYVITPKSHFKYRDVDQPGDGSIRKWLQEIPQYLKEGGYAQLLMNWIIRENQSWEQTVQSYLDNLPLDSWLIYNGSKSPEEYAGIWIDTETKNNFGLFETTRLAWQDWFQEKGIKQIGLGTLTLRRRSTAKNWFRAIPVKKSLDGQAGEQFIRMFAAQDYLDKLESQQDLLRAVLQKVNLEITPQVDQINSVYSSKEMHIQVTLNSATMVILNTLDGRVVLQKALDRIELEGFVGSDIAKVVLNDIEMLIQLGMLVPQTPSRHPI
jgi:SAM-dependent methyltransferase